MAFDDKDPFEIIKNLEIENMTLRADLDKALSVKNNDKLSKLEHSKDKQICNESTNLEAFNTFGPAYVSCNISKHKESDFIYINFIPAVAGNLSIAMTEKSYVKFAKAIDIFKMKYINTRPFEDEENI